MSKLIEFTLLYDQPVRVQVNPSHVEAIVEGDHFAKGVSCTQINLSSGTKFFVKEVYEHVRACLMAVSNL